MNMLLSKIDKTKDFSWESVKRTSTFLRTLAEKNPLLYLPILEMKLFHDTLGIIVGKRPRYRHVTYSGSSSYCARILLYNSEKSLFWVR